MSNRKVAVIVGALFFTQMITFMIGSALIQSFLDGKDSTASLHTGVFLEMCSGVAVVIIGLLLYRVLKPINQRLAIAYPVLRITEFLVSASLATYLLIKLQEVPNHLLWVYIPTAIGGLVLTYLLFISKLVPRSIAVLGLVGYALLMLGVILDFAGVVSVDKGAGLLLFVPGGLFEFILLPMWLIAKGFNPAAKTSNVMAGTV
jgi:hypothetical protein